MDDDAGQSHIFFINGIHDRTHGVQILCGESADFSDDGLRSRNCERVQSVAAGGKIIQ